MKIEKNSWYWGAARESVNIATHPGYAYYTHQNGILLFGRPIRSNFYVYKLDDLKGVTLGKMLDANAPDDEIFAFLEAHEIKWSQNVSRDGYESRFDG